MSHSKFSEQDTKQDTTLLLLVDVETHWPQSNKPLHIKYNAKTRERETKDEEEGKESKFALTVKHARSL